jgi:hypothetical protein
VWTMRSWVRLVVLVVLSGALVGALAVPALGQVADPPLPPPETRQETLDRLREDLARRLEEMRTAREQRPEEREHSILYYAWEVATGVSDLIAWADDPDEKQQARAAEEEARQVEQDELARRAAQEADQTGQPDATDQPGPETAASGEQPAPADAQNQANLSLSGSDDQEQGGEGLEWMDGTIVNQPGSVVGANGGVVGGQWEPDGTGEQEDPTQLDAIGGAVGAGTDNRGFNPFGDLFSEQFTTPNPDLGPGILITPQPDLNLGPGILVTPQPPLGPDQEILVPPELELGGGPGEEIWLPPELGPDREILLPPHDLPGVTDRVALAA